MLLGIDQMRTNVVLDDFRHEAGHGATCTRNQMHDLVTRRFANKRPLNPFHLASNAADARQ